MTKEQKGALNELKYLLFIYKDDDTNKYKNTGIVFDKDFEAIETILNMLKEKDKEIETLKRDFKIVDQECSRLERKEAKKEKQTDLMAEYISKIDIEEDICIKNKTNPDWCNEDYTNCKDCIKQYFKELAERKNE